jgi:hypothetical protein
VQFVLDVGTQLQHRALDDAVEDVGLHPHQDRRDDVEEEHDHEYARERAEVDALPRDDGHAGQQIGELSVAPRPSRVDCLLLGDARG